MRGGEGLPIPVVLVLTLSGAAFAQQPQGFQPDAYPAPAPAAAPAPAPAPAVVPAPVEPPDAGVEAAPPTEEVLTELPDGGLSSQQVVAPPPAVTPPAEATPSEPPPQGQGELKVHGALEGSFVSFPSGTPGGQQDLYFNVLPIIGLDAGDDFALELGPLLRLRLFDDPPEQRSGDVGHILRGADWDELSDFGQIIRSLRIGRPDHVFWAQVGGVQKETLGQGHLVTRYSNQDNPDYHPASAELGVMLDALRVEAFASDIFAARLFAGEATLDLGRVASNDPQWRDRFRVAVSLAADLGRSKQRAPGATLGALDLTAVLWRGSKARILAVLGAAGRADVVSGGAVVGVALDALFDPIDFGGKVEVRKQGGGFRFGYFGAGYEVARFSGIGFTQPPLAEESLTDSYSVYIELRSALGKLAVGDMALEHYGWGRTDLDVSGTFLLIGDRLAATTRFTMVGVGVKPRYAFTAEGRFRIFPALYVLVSAGTVFFPQPDGTLVRGVFAGAGAGVDFER